MAKAKVSDVEKCAFALIDPHYIELIRHPDPHRRNPIEYGELEQATATGRARCRSCGQKIAKGAPELRFFWDFTGSGSWTAVEVHIHRENCQ